MLGNPLLLGDDGYNISRSARLRSSASAYFSRTPASAGNRKTWTWSGWVKRGLINATQQTLFSYATSTSAFTVIQFSDSLSMWTYNGGTVNQLVTNAVYRDPSAWYHILVAVDTTQATGSNRIKLYVNGVQSTSFSTESYGSQNADTFINAAIEGNIGRMPTYGQVYDGYMADVYCIDGQALTPSSFGETDLITGVWKPKKYAGTYGTNGFYLNFSDNSNNTAATIGKDSSGNGNNWTPNNISVTSGSTYDSMLDVPTMWADGGNGRGNYAVINPLDGTFTDYKPTNGNLTQTSGSNWNTSRGNWGMSSGKWYWETVHSVYNQSICGIADKDWPTTTYYPGYSSTGYSAGFGNAGYKYVDGAAGVVYGTAFTTGDVIGYALDMDAGTLTCYINGTSQGTMVSGLTAYGTIFPAIAAANGATINANFGQRPFAYTPPTGFKALNTQNLPDATIKKGNAYFDATTFAANNSSQVITNAAGFQPDLVWAKSRSNAYSHELWDSSRGVNNILFSNATTAETATANSLTSFNSNGFTLGAASNANYGSGNSIGWQWKESVSAGFDIVTFTNPSSGSSSFSHSLGVKPSMIIVKARSNTSNWTCTHKSLGTNMADKWINLESTAAVQTSSNIWGGEPTSSVFYCGTGIQVASATMVAYLFAEVAGFSKFGSYTGNGSADGPFVYTGFRPRWVMVKRTDAVADWYVIDTSRDTYNLSSAILYPNLSNAEASNGLYDYLSNGFKLRNAGSAVNASGGTYIYAAFAENPFKNSLAR